MCAIYRKSSNKPPGSLIYFQHRRWDGGGGLLNRDGGLCGSGLICFSRDDGFSSPKRTKVDRGKAQVREVGGHSAEDQTQIRTCSWWINHPGSVHMKFYSRDWSVIQSIIYDWRIIRGKGRGLKERMAWYLFSSPENGWPPRERGLRGVLNRGLTVSW